MDGKWDHEITKFSLPPRMTLVSRCFIDLRGITIKSKNTYVAKSVRVQMFTAHYFLVHCISEEMNFCIIRLSTSFGKHRILSWFASCVILMQMKSTSSCNPGNFCTFFWGGVKGKTNWPKTRMVDILSFMLTLKHSACYSL